MQQFLVLTQHFLLISLMNIYTTSGFSSILVNPWNDSLRCDNITYYDNITRRNLDTALIRRPWFDNHDLRHHRHVVRVLPRRVARAALCVPISSADSL